MTKLGVNIDHIASIRNLRSGVEPEPVTASCICELAGADSIVVHLREDRRHIKDRDLFILKHIVKTKLNLEMSISKEIVDIACQVKPNQATLVPERRLEITTEGGLDVIKYKSQIRNIIKKLKKNNIEVSLFIDPDNRQITASKEIGVKIVELHTGKYANSSSEKLKNRFLEELTNSVNFARELGLTINAGHGLNYYNVKPIAQIQGIEELNIGYSIICRAAIVGLEKAVRDMIKIINK
ncbi:MAG: pyridoxine 5'-phosphate synthase [Candidatus Omnitrophota bacterium]